MEVLPAHHLLDGVFHRVAEGAAAHAVFDRDIALIIFAIDLGTFVRFLNLQSCSSETRSPEGASSRMFLSLPWCPILRQIAELEVIGLLALKDLGEGITSNRGLNSILHVGHVDLKSRRLLTIHYKVQVRLTCDLKDPKISNTGNAAHDADLSRLIFEYMQIVAVDLVASSPLTPLTASSMLSSIGCEKPQTTPGSLLES